MIGNIKPNEIYYVSLHGYMDKKTSEINVFGPVLENRNDISAAAPANRMIYDTMFGGLLSLVNYNETYTPKYLDMKKYEFRRVVVGTVVERRIADPTIASMVRAGSLLTVEDAGVRMPEFNFFNDHNEMWEQQKK